MSISLMKENEPVFTIGVEPGKFYRRKQWVLYVHVRCVVEPYAYFRSEKHAIKFNNYLNKIGEAFK